MRLVIQQQQQQQQQQNKTKQKKSIKRHMLTSNTPISVSVSPRHARRFYMLVAVNFNRQRKSPGVPASATATFAIKIADI